MSESSDQFPDLELDRASIRRFNSVPRRSLSVLALHDTHPRLFDWSTHHFETKDLENGFGYVLIYTHRAFITNKGKDIKPFKLLVMSNELSRVRDQLQERKRLSRTKPMPGARS